MMFSVYVAENCHQCQEIIDYLNKLGKDIPIYNVDLQPKQPPISVFAFPALFKGDILLRYGSDIIEYLDAENQKLKMT